MTRMRSRTPIRSLRTVTALMGVVLLLSGCDFNLLQASPVRLKPASAQVSGATDVIDANAAAPDATGSPGDGAQGRAPAASRKNAGDGGRDRSGRTARVTDGANATQGDGEAAENTSSGTTSASRTDPTSASPTDPSPPASTSSTSPVESESSGAATGNDAVVWTTDHEDGGLRDWSSDGGGGEFNSGSGDATASQAVARSGSWSSRMTIQGSGGTRLFRWKESRNLDQAYYSAWFFFPRSYETPSGWWNIFQFKSRTTDRNDPFWIVNVGQRDGGMYLYLYDWMARRSYSQSDLAVPIGQWVHIELFLDQSANGTGRLMAWQDDKLLWNLSGITTKYPDSSNEWSVNNYSAGLTPDTATIYMDDPAISRARMGSGG